MKQFLFLLLGAMIGLAPLGAQPDLDVDFDDCDCPMVDTPPVCAEVMPGLVIALPSACFADCMGLTIIEGGDCAIGWDGDWDEDDYGDWDDWGDDDDDYGDWDNDDSDDDDDDDYGDWDNDDSDDDDDDDYGDWDDDDSDDDDDDYGDWDDDDSDDDDYGDWNGDWNDSLTTDIDFDELDSLLNDWLANGGQAIVDSLLDALNGGGLVDFPNGGMDVNLDSLLASGDFSWLDSLLVGGGFPGFPGDFPGDFPGGTLDSLLGDFDWNELDSLIGGGGLTWDGLDIDLDEMWEEKGPGEELVNFGTGHSRQGQAPQLLTWMCFPNPVNTQLNIQADAAVRTVEIWSATGQLMARHTTAFEGQEVFDVSALAAGNYVIRLQDENGVWQSKQVLVH